MKSKGGASEVWFRAIHTVKPTNGEYDEKCGRGDVMLIQENPDGTRTRFAHFYGVNAIRLAQWHYKGKESLFNMAIVRGEPMTPNQFQELYNV